VTEAIEVGTGRAAPLRLAGVLFAAAFTALAVGIGINLPMFRSVEAGAAAAFTRRLLGLRTVHLTGSDTFYFAHQGAWRGLQVSDECSAGILTAIVCALAAFLFLVGRATIGRGLLAAAAASDLVVLANQLRLVVVAWAYARWGDAGYHWSHVVVGSLITMLAALAGYVLFFLILFHREERAR
jgi:exosortase/archaeosortase family protein